MIVNVEDRLNLAERAFDVHKHKMNRLRQMLFGAGVGVSLDPSAQVYGEADAYGDVFIDRFDDGRSNRLLKSLKILIQKITFTSPIVSVHSVDDAIGLLNSAYLQDVITRTNAGKAIESALWDALIVGRGIVFVGFEDDHVIDFVDFRDALYHPCQDNDIYWFARRVKMTAYKAEQIFGELIAKFFSQNVHADDIICLLDYYDVDENERRIYYLGNQHSLSPSPNMMIYKGDSPYSELPACFIDALRPPGVRLPIGVVEMVLPNQMAKWEAERVEKEIIRRTVPFYTARKNALTAEQRALFEDGEVASIVEVESGDPASAIYLHSMGNVSPSFSSYSAEQVNEILQHSGVEPYSAGGRMEGVAFASEVTAIIANAGLTSAWMSKKQAALWEAVLQKALVNGAKFDTHPFKTQFDGETITFDALNPINEYLAAEGKVIVSEDMMSFKPKNEQIMEALQALNVSIGLAEYFPNALAIDFKKYLTARGVKNLNEYFSQPTEQTERLIGEEVANA